MSASGSPGIPADHLPSLLHASHDATLVLRFANDELTVIGGNEKWADLCGTPVRDLMRRTAASCLSPELVQVIDRHVRDGLPSGRPLELEAHEDHLVGSAQAEVVLLGVEPDPDQQFLLVHATSGATEAGPQRSMVERTSTPMLAVGADLMVTYANAAAMQLFADNGRGIAGLDLRSLVSSDSLPDITDAVGDGSDEPVRATMIAGGGRRLPAEITVSPFAADQGGAVLVIRDMTDQQRHEQELAGLSAVDGLTGLANRQAFVEHIHVVASSLAPVELTVAFLDLDNFKPINDVLGHDQGDLVLQTIAKRLDHTIGDQGLVARFGGDEFVVATSAAPGTGHAELEYLLDLAFTEPVELDGKQFTITVSAGIVTTDEPTQMRPDTMLKAADIAMYEAKRRGKDCVAVYDESLEHQATARLEIESDLRRAIAEEQFVLHYQPIVDVISGRPVGAEALVRWEHPERGMVRPDEFIPVAETTGLIVPLGAWVVETAIAQTAAWNLQRLTRRALGVSVNLSSLQLADPKLEQHVRAALSRHGLDPSKLTLEVTESTLMSDAEDAMDILNRFRDLGVRIAIDDFGTGYSSLAYLKRLPANSLKVDKAFVDGLGISTEDTSLVTGIVGLASALDLAVVAEGVENETQLRELRRLGCEYSQGYHHSRPLPAEEFSRWLGLETEVVAEAEESAPSGDPTLGERLAALVGPRHDEVEAEPDVTPIRVQRDEDGDRPMLFDQDSAIG